MQLQYSSVYVISGITVYSYLRYTNMLFNVVFLFFAVILSEKLRRKDWVKEESP